jgi:sorbitol-specific phosphotransferase system component IIBC
MQKVWTWMQLRSRYLARQILPFMADPNCKGIFYAISSALAILASITPLAFAVPGLLVISKVVSMSQRSTAQSDGE